MSDEKRIPLPCDGYAVLRIERPERSGIILPEGTESAAEVERHIMVTNSGRHVVGNVVIESKIGAGDICILAPRTIRAQDMDMPKDICLVRLMDIAAWYPGSTVQ